LQAGKFKASASKNTGRIRAPSGENEPILSAKTWLSPWRTLYFYTHTTSL
jgi:hypothetical protein